MNINGRGLRDHLRLVAPLYGLIGAVWALRMILAAAGAPRGVVVTTSVTVATSFSVLVAVLLMHVRRFGSYPNVAVVAFLLTLWENLLIVTAVAFASLTGKANIYTAPQYSGRAISNEQHIILQLTFGIGFGTIFATAMGCLLLWLLRQLPRETSRQKR